jgi:hypothetical protein
VDAITRELHLETPIQTDHRPGVAPQKHPLEHAQPALAEEDPHPPTERPEQRLPHLGTIPPERGGGNGKRLRGALHVEGRQEFRDGIPRDPGCGGLLAHTGQTLHHVGQSLGDDREELVAKP